MTQDISIPETLPGIDVRKAVSSLGGNRLLFVKVVSEFKKRYEQLPEQLAEALETGDAELARRLSHTVKGVSGMFCATGLYNASKTLEDAVKNGQNPKPGGAVFETFRHCFEQVIESAKSLDRICGSAAVPDQDIFRDGQESSVGQILSELLQLLQKHAPKAEIYLNSVKPRFIRLGFEKEINMIEDQLSRYDFAASCASVRSLAASLQTDLNP